MTDDDLQAWAAARRQPRPSPAEGHALVERWTRRTWRRRAGLTGLGLALATALVAIVLLGPLAPRTPEPRPAPVATAERPEPRVLEPGRHEEDGDEIEVADASAVRVAGPGRLVLTAGTVRVKARARPADAPLTVTAGQTTVTVVGTRFSVTLEPLRVSVSEGAVVVTHAGEQHPVAANESWPPPPAPPPFDLDALVDRAASDPEGVREALVDRLAARPHDADAWALLGRIESRAGRPAAAAEAFERAQAHGRPSVARRARFELARLLEDRPHQAIRWLEAYLDDPGPWVPEARLRLGRALLSIGDPLAEPTLRRVVEEHPGTAAAAEARALLGDAR